MIINRADELKILECLHKEKRPKLLILYGRRRVGKTELLTEFARKHKALYMVAREESIKDQLRKMSEETAAFHKDELLKLNPFQNYDSLFTYLLKKQTPVIFDEFPYLVKSYNPLKSILQEHWDKKFSKRNSFIILCGSSIAMMEDLMSYKSPLYGRRTEQILLEPLKFQDACKFFPKLSAEQKVIHYAILGGTPAYLLKFNYSKPLPTNLREEVLQKTKFLHQDTQYVIKQELNEPSTYYSIIKSIAKGNTKIGNITNDTGIDKEKAIKYLSVLQNLQLVERRVPITEKNPKKSRKGIYLLRDNYFKFWFRFIFENEEYIEQNRQEKLLTEKIQPELNEFTGKAFEEIALEWIKGTKEFDSYLFGRWWDRNDEIDIVGIDKQHNRIVFGEVKWKQLTLKQARQIITQLKSKSEKVNFGNKPKKKFMLIAKKIEGKLQLIKEGHRLFELKDIIK